MLSGEGKEQPAGRNSTRSVAFNKLFYGGALMGIWERIVLFFKVKASADLDRAEDPREILDYAAHEQEAFLQTVRAGLIDVATAKQQLVQQVKSMRDRIPKLDQQARKAVESGREDLARMALSRKQTALYELESLEAQLAELDAEEARLAAAEQQIADRVASFRMHKEAAKARYSAAEAQVRIGETLTGVSGDLGELTLALGRAEEKTNQMIARAKAIDALTAGGSLSTVLPDGSDMIDRELQLIASDKAVEQELALLIAKVEQPKLTASSEN
jgi:phage shock protein A